MFVSTFNYSWTCDASVSKIKLKIHYHNFTSWSVYFNGPTHHTTACDCVSERNTWTWPDLGTVSKMCHDDLNSRAKKLMNDLHQNRKWIITKMRWNKNNCDIVCVYQIDLTQRLLPTYEPGHIWRFSCHGIRCWLVQESER